MINWETLGFISILMIGYYLIYLLIRPVMSYSGRRFTLLVMPLLAVVAVLIQSFIPGQTNMINIPVVEMDAVLIDARATSSADWVINWRTIYLLGAGIVLSFLIYKVYRLLYFFRNAVPLISDSRVKVLVSPEKDSFSFFNLIHLSAELDGDERNVVLEHEMLHYKKSHSLDLILMELYQALFWFNPLIYLIKRELIQIHEFEVDRDMFEKYNESYLGHLLSYTLGASVAHLLLTSQFYSRMTLAKRIEKMKINKNSNRFMLLLIPALTVLVALTSWTYNNKSEKHTSVFSAHYGNDGDHEKHPKYVGGKEALIAFISENVKYPKTAEKDNIQGTVHVSFIVEASGKVSNVKVAKSDHEIFNKEAVRVVKMMPNWKPAMKDGKAVNAEMTLPITFKL